MYDISAATRHGSKWGKSDCRAEHPFKQTYQHIFHRRLAAGWSEKFNKNPVETVDIAFHRFKSPKKLWIFHVSPINVHFFITTQTKTKRVAFEAKSIVKWHKINVREMSPQVLKGARRATERKTMNSEWIWIERKWFGYKNIDVWYIKENIFNFIFSIEWSLPFCHSHLPGFITFHSVPRRVWITRRQIEILTWTIFTSSH